MRVLIDTNILFSALLLPKSVPARMVSAVYHAGKIIRNAKDQTILNVAMLYEIVFWHAVKIFSAWHGIPEMFN